MKCARVSFKHDGQVFTIPGLKVLRWVSRWKQVGGNKKPSERYSCKFGGVFLDAKDGNLPEIATKPPCKEGEEPTHLVYEASLEEVKVRGKDPFFVMTKERDDDKGKKILLLINTRGTDIEGKDGDIVGSQSHVDGLPGVCLKGQHSTYLIAMTVMARGEAITITPQGGSPILLRYEGGQRFSTTAAPIARAIAKAVPESETQRERREAAPAEAAQ